ncbi:hypothetical protein [Cellulomonas endophytica]|uniref:hypothetical protein n=1 Tax=Cellulomonas endophytica TaxID=2494735 RepID=UPI001011522A|nr:hypothetical protein [Cellulomonas endophytica]
MGAPARPLPARVYWVRRAVVLGLPLLLVAVLVVWLATAGADPGAPERGGGAEGPAAPAAGGTTGDADPAGAGAAATPTAPPPTPSPSPTTVGGVAVCAPADLAVTLTPAAPEFPAGSDPTFEIGLRNTGDAPCLVDAGEAHRELVLTSGTDRVWSNKDCAPADDSRPLLLAADAVDTSTLAWPRERSAAGCPGGLPSPGAGTYALTLRVGGVDAAPAVFTLG